MTANSAQLSNAQKNIHTYIIGLGPLKNQLSHQAVLTLGLLDVLVYPATGESSLALEMARPFLKEKTLQIGIDLAIKNQKEPKYFKFIQIIKEYKNKNYCIGLACLGDPTLYGSANYIMALLQTHGIAFKVIPGINSAAMAASFLQLPLAQKNESFCMLSCAGPFATLQDKLKSALLHFEQIALLKPCQNTWNDVHALLKKHQLLECSWCVTTLNQHVSSEPLNQISPTQCPHYFSVILVQNNLLF